MQPVPPKFLIGSFQDKKIDILTESASEALSRNNPLVVYVCDHHAGTTKQQSRDKNLLREKSSFPVSSYKKESLARCVG